MRRSLLVFFLRTWFFRPANHPVLPVAVILIVFFGLLHSVERTHVAAVVYATVLAHAVTGGLFAMRAGTRRSDAARFFEHLPVARGTVVRSYLAASLVYAAMSLAILGPLLWREVRLPGWKFIEVFEGTDEAGYPALYVKGIDQDARGLPHEITMVWPRSPMAEMIRLAPHARAFLASYYVAILFYLAAWHLYREGRRPGRGARFAAGIPLAVYALLAVAVAARYLISPDSLHRWYRTIPEAESTIAASVAAITVMTSTAGLLMARAASRDVE